MSETYTWLGIKVTLEQKSQLEELNQQVRGHLVKLINKGVLTPEKDKHGEKVSLKYIQDSIGKFCDEHAEEILDFLGESGKIFVPMNSAAHFADGILRRLGIPEERVTRYKVSTYGDDMKSSGKDISEGSKQDIDQLMNLQEGDKILIIEDMIDTGNTLEGLDNFFSLKGCVGKSICLFDKQVEEGNRVKGRLGERLKSIIPVGDSFIIGYGLDYSERLCSDLKGLWKVSDVVAFLEAMKPYAEQVKTILR